MSRTKSPITGIVSFNVDGIHPHDVAQILDMDAVELLVAKLSLHRGKQAAQIEKA